MMFYDHFMYTCANVETKCTKCVEDVENAQIVYAESV